MREIFLHLLDVCHGDCILVGDDRINILIDGGYPTAEKHAANSEVQHKVFTYLDCHNINHIDYYIISHFHADHFGIASKILEKFKPTKIFIPFSIEEGKFFVENIDLENEKTAFGVACKKCFQEFCSSVINNKLENNLVVIKNSLNFKYTIPLKDYVFTVYNPIDDNLKDLNQNNTVNNNLNNKSAMFFTLIGGKSNALIFSDTEANANKKVHEILLSLIGYEFQIIKLPHHGDLSSKYFDKEFYNQRKDTIKTVLVSGGINRYFVFDTTNSRDLDQFTEKYQFSTLSTYKNGDILIDLSNGG